MALSLVAMETLHSSFSFLGCCDKQGLVLHVLSVEHVLILTSATSAQIAVSDAFRSATLSIGRIDADVSNKLYHTRTTPFAYLGHSLK